MAGEVAAAQVAAQIAAAIQRVDVERARAEALAVEVDAARAEAGQAQECTTAVEVDLATGRAQGEAAQVRVAAVEEALAAAVEAAATAREGAARAEAQRNAAQGCAEVEHAHGAQRLEDLTRAHQARLTEAVRSPGRPTPREGEQGEVQMLEGQTTIDMPTAGLTGLPEPTSPPTARSGRGSCQDP